VGVFPLSAGPRCFLTLRSVQDEELRQAYVRTVISACVPDAGWMGAADLLARFPGPSHVLTAWNPGHERLPHAANAHANRRLEARIRGRGPTVFEARGESPDGDHAEDSFAVIGLSRDAAVALGREFRQAAIFELIDGMQIVVGCEGDWELRRPLTT
jgi:Protein of unknown function (DUF3293)